MADAPVFIGNLRIDRVEELCAPLIRLHDLLPDLPEDAIERHRDWLFPTHIDPASGLAVMSEHSWVVRTPHHNVLIDGCWGNHKPRPGFGNGLDTPWLARLAEIGLRPDDIDFVMCTHLHADHVGWNTRLVDGRWVPTFPNARYLFGRGEYDYWEGRVDTTRFGHGAAFQDSVLPCVAAGLAELVDGGHAVGDHLLIEAAPGHTSGNLVIRASSDGRSALFSGDVVHAPIQLYYPEVNSIACDLPELARSTRQRILDEAVEYGHLLFPGHFAAPHFGSVSRRSHGFAYHPGSSPRRISDPRPR